MTIAACYLSPEGVILGADSTSTLGTPEGFHFFNHGQKIFEIGQNSTLGVVTWGLGGLSVGSYRTLLAILDDDIRSNPPVNVAEVASRWATQFWNAYETSQIAAQIVVCRTLAAKGPHDPNLPPSAQVRTADEEKELEELRLQLSVGFCIAGYLLPDRTPQAFVIGFDPVATAAPAPVPLVLGPAFWGAPIMIKRLLYGVDDRLKGMILQSGLWQGTEADLDALIDQLILTHGLLPIRDAIDFVFTCVLSTIKSFKFSNFSQICGGPIELAVITTDRSFRWVRHKAWDSAITEGGQ